MAHGPVTAFRMPLCKTGAVAVLVAALWLSGCGDDGEKAFAQEPPAVPAELEIEKLAVCYALGTDAIGRGDVEEGKEIYDGCFTENAEISVFFPTPENDFTREPDVTQVGTDDWADFVASVFQTSGYTATQHLLGTINIDVNGDSARMTSYLHATHKRSETSIDVANGTYEDEVVRQNGQWRIQRRVLKLITFLNLSSPPAP